MCAAIQQPEAAGLRATVTAVVAPVTGPRAARYTCDLVRLVRTAGSRVAGSTRLPAWRTQPLVERRYQEAASAMRTACAGLAGSGPVRPQSVLITAGARLRVLARLESPAGPVLAGGAGPAAVAGMLSAVAQLSQLPGAPASPPRGWDQCPLLARPPVAAVLLAGVRLVLGGAVAGKLAGRRVLPDLNLVDRPVAHLDGSPDDCGRPARPHTIVRSGRIAPPPRESCPGVPAGRAVWRHDESRMAIAATFGLTLSGMPPAPRPDDAVALLACVEGLRRYYPDGQLHMVCLARAPGTASTFLVAIRARPLSLLRAVTGLAGAAADTYLEHEITTPSLVLPSAAELARKSHVHICSL